MGMAVDVRAHHDPIWPSARQIGNQHVRPGWMIIAVDDNAGGWERAVRRTLEHLRHFDANPERRNPSAAIPPTRP